MDWGKVGESIVANLTVASVVAIAGFLVWRWQTIFKRRFEVAEQALIQFAQVEAVLQEIRTYRPYSNDEKHSKPRPNYSEKEKAIHWAWEQTYSDYEASKPQQDELVGLARLCRFHLGRKAEASILTLHKSFKAIPRGYISFDLFAGPKPANITYSDEEWERQRAEVNASPVFIMRKDSGGVTETDEISKQISKARLDLEAVCARYHEVNVFKQMLGITKR